MVLATIAIQRYAVGGRIQYQKAYRYEAMLYESKLGA